MTQKIDLHSHSTASDGTFEPSEVIEYAVKQNLTAVALTDHDTINGITEAIETANRLNIEFVPGIEFSTEIGDNSIHIVGLYVDHTDKELIALCKKIVDARFLRAKKMIDKINALNVGPEITFEEVEELATDLIARPHIAQTLLNKGIVESISEAFDRFISRGAPCYVPRFKMTPREAITFLKEKEAIPILAHPGLLRDEFNLEEFLKEHIPLGLAGMELYYPIHTSEQKAYFKNLIQKFDILPSGGSDCHGTLNGGPFLGSLDIPYSVLEQLKNRYNKP
jgi:hypothetical protein